MIDVMCLNHPPGLWKNCLPLNRSLEPKRLDTTALKCRSDHAVAQLEVLQCNSPSPQAGRGANPLASGADFSLLPPLYLFLTWASCSIHRERARFLMLLSHSPRSLPNGLLSVKFLLTLSWWLPLCQLCTLHLTYLHVRIWFVYWRRK